MFDKIAEYLFIDLKDLIKCVNETPEQFLREYNFTFDETKDKLQITKNDEIKYIYENNFLTRYEIRKTGGITQFNMGESFVIEYPSFIE